MPGLKLKIQTMNRAGAFHSLFIFSMCCLGLPSQEDSYRTHAAADGPAAGQTVWSYILLYILPALFIIYTIYILSTYISRKRYTIRLEEEVRQRTQRLEASEKEIRNIYDSAHDAIIVFGPEEEIVYDVNKRACEIYGFSRDEFIGMSLEKISKNVNRGKAKVRETLRQGDYLNFQTVQYRKNGSEMHLEINASVINYRDKIAILSINRDITQRNLAEQQIKKSLLEKEVLLKEIHHRVKNNLQIISSLMDLQLDAMEGLKDPKALQLFRQSKDRISSMALIHENIYRSHDLARIDGVKYIEELLDYFFSAYGSKIDSVTPFIKIEKPLTSISLTMETAIPMGLILTELLTNALKHAFPPDLFGRKKEIHIVFSSESGDTLTLTVSDNSVGLPGGIGNRRGRWQTLGLQLVSLLTRQLKGTLKLEGNAEIGTSVKITFPYRPG
ncbi:MAG: PAS domain S-box protein [Candidatus Aminicenantes bacterium]|nr:PAS domain S-box protein [Candidatus Aminicenantes bacterium]